MFLYFRICIVMVIDKQPINSNVVKVFCSAFVLYFSNLSSSLSRKKVYITKVVALKILNKKI